jgi:hypothetical protein
MRASPRRLLSYASFVGLLLLDVVALLSLLIVQLLGAPMPVAWVAAGILAALAVPALLKLADKVFEMARNGGTVPDTGESFL